MRLAFLTMVWRDYWLLEKWVAHNAAIVPKSQLYVINHGGDPEIDRIAAGCNLIHVPRDEVTIDLTRRRWDLLGGVLRGLLAFYDRVVCTDVDEFLVYIGDAENLVAHLAAKDSAADAIAPVCLNLIPSEAGKTTDDRPILEQHPEAMLSARYTKPCIARTPVDYTVGGHGILAGTFDLDPDILLLHLHYVTPDYADRMMARRDIVTESRKRNQDADDPVEVRNRFWINWANPFVIRRKEFEKFETATLLDVSDGFEGCVALLDKARSKPPYDVMISTKRMDATLTRIVIPNRLRGLL